MLVGKSFKLLVSVGSGSFEDVFDVASDLGDCFFAVLYLQEGEDDYNDFYDEDENAHEDGKVAETRFPVVVAAPGGSPVDDPDEIHQKRHGHQVPDTGLLLDVGIVPKEQDEREEREVVVGALEVGKERQDYHHHEELVYVLDHSIYSNYI